MKIQSILLATTLLSAPAFATQTNFDFVEAGYAKLSLDENELPNASGVGFKVSKAINESFVIKADYITTSANKTISESDSYLDVNVAIDLALDLDFTQYSLGLGYLWNLNEQSTIETGAYFGKIDIDLNANVTASASYLGESHSESESDSDSGNANIIGAFAKYHYALNDQLTLVGGIGYERLDGEDEDNSNGFYQAELDYKFTDNFSANIAYRDAKDYTNTGLNIRYYF